MNLISLKYDFCIKEVMENEIVRKRNGIVMQKTSMYVNGQGSRD